MADTTSRVLELLSLLQARRTWSGQELIRRLEVSERTLRRDIDRLRQLGYPVRATSGPSGGYQLEAGANIPPLLLDDEEAVAVAAGLLTAAGGSITGIEETSARALAKLRQVLPPRVSRRVGMLQSMVVPLFRPWATVDADTLSTLAQACRDAERVRFEYRSRTGELTERNVEPHQLVSLHQRWYLLAFDRDRDDWRTFRLDRMDSPRPTRFRFTRRAIPGDDPAAFVLAALGSRPMRYRARARLEASAEEVEQRTHSGEATVESMGQGRCTIQLQGDSLEWLAFRILWLDVDFVIHEPPELIDYMAGLSHRLTRSAAGGPS